MLPKFTYTRPASLDQALAVLDDRPALVHGGGTDLIGCLRDGILKADTVVSLSAIDELMARRSHLQNYGDKPRCWYYRGDFAWLRKGGEKCFAYAGENQYHCIFGGDICYIVHPSDTAPMLAALGAVCRISGGRSSRSVAVEKFNVPPSEDPRRETVLEVDEVVTEIVIPAPPAGLRTSYRKVRTRQAWDFAIAGVALALVFDGDTVTSAAVFLSGVAPVPWRATAVEAAITGRALDPATIKTAAEAAVAGAEPLSENGYKVPLVKGLVAEQLEAFNV